MTNDFPTAPAAGAAPTTLDLDVRGMSCGGCVAAVTRALGAVPGVRVHDVTVGAASAALEPGTSPDAALAAVRGAGFDASVARRDA